MTGHSQQANEVLELFAENLSLASAKLVGEADSGGLFTLITRICSQTLGATGTGLLVVDPRGGLEVVCTSDDNAEFLELLQEQVGEGPCIDCIRQARPVEAGDLRTERSWPRFSETAVQAGYLAFSASPMRLEGHVIGGLNLMFAQPTVLTPWQRQVAQTMADLAVLGLIQEDHRQRGELLAERTITALNNRAHFAQAVGMIAGTTGISPPIAREALIRYAQRRGLSLRELSSGITARTVDPADVVTEER